MSRPHIMVDLETWASSSDAQLRSIGAVVFDPHAEPGTFGPKFYCNVADYSQCGGLPGPMIPFRRSADTAAWWDKQGEAAKAAFASPEPVTPIEAVKTFAAWAAQQRGYYIWANSPSFDLAILRHHFDVLEVPCPWRYSSELDYRTVKALFMRGNPPSRAGFVHHRADDDAAWQAKNIQAAVAANKLSFA